MANGWQDTVIGKSGSCNIGCARAHAPTQSRCKQCKCRCMHAQRHECMQVPPAKQCQQVFFAPHSWAGSRPPSKPGWEPSHRWPPGHNNIAGGGRRPCFATNCRICSASVAARGKTLPEPCIGPHIRHKRMVNSSDSPCLRTPTERNFISSPPMVVTQK